MYLKKSIKCIKNLFCAAASIYRPFGENVAKVAGGFSVSPKSSIKQSGLITFI